MLNDYKMIFDKLDKESLPFGSISIKLYYHENRLVKYEIIKSETTVIKEGGKNG